MRGREKGGAKRAAEKTVLDPTQIEKGWGKKSRPIRYDA